MAWAVHTILPQDEHILIFALKGAQLLYCQWHEWTDPFPSSTVSLECIIIKIWTAGFCA